MDHSSHDHSAMGSGFNNSMDHGSMDHGSMDHGSMDHGSMDHGSMDHGSMNHASMDHGSMGGMMSMAFHFGYNEVILIDQWKISTVGGLVASMVVIIIMAALYEGLKYFREYLFWKTYNSLQYRAVTVPEKQVVSEDNSRVLHMVGEVIHKQPQFTSRPTMCSPMHCFQTLLHIIQVTLSFLLMLIFMTFNVWLCLAVVIGAAIGYFLFGWKKSVIVDVTEHCH